MINKSRKIKLILNSLIYFIFACILFYSDLALFSWLNKPLLQLLLCAYIVLLTKQRSNIILSITITLLCLESILFFGQIEYFLFFTLLAYISVKLFKELIQISIAIPLVTLNINLVIQKLFSIIYLHQTYNDFLYTIGHFFINMLFLILYWIFENNGK